MFGLEFLSSFLRDNTPEISPNRCLRRFTKSRCQACFDACPSGAINLEMRPFIDEAECVECGICVARCPVGVFAMPKPTLPALVASLVASRVHRFVCYIGSGAGIGVRVPCLGFLDEAILLLAARQWQSVVLDASRCERCSLGAMLADLQYRVDRANRILAAFGLERILVLAARGDASTPMEPAHACSRRELFSLFKAESVKSVLDIASRQSIPFISTTPADHRLAAHHALMRQIRVLAASVPVGSPDTVVTDRPTVGSKCDSCGLCAAACPDSALAIVPGAKTLDLELDAVRCSACGLCSDVCPKESVQMEAKVTLSDVLAKRSFVLHRGEKAICTKCGDLADARHGLCLHCAKELDMNGFAP